MIATNETALYYPYMEPPSAWTKQALLMFDRVSSIMPEQDRLLAVPSSLEFLRHEGLWTPAEVRGRLGPLYLADIEDALLTFAYRPEYQFLKGMMPRLEDLSRLYVGKLTEEVERALLELQLVKMGRYGGTLSIHRNVAEVILSVTAKHYASEYSTVTGRIIPSTDLAESEEHAFSADGSRSQSLTCREVVMRSILPVPGAEVSYDDVVSFRRSNSDEVLAFRVALDRLVERFSSAEDVTDAAHTVITEVESALTDLQAAAASRSVRILRGVGLALLIGAAGRVGFGKEVSDSLMVGIGGSASVEVVMRAVRPPAPRNGLAYALRCQQAFG